MKPITSLAMALEEAAKSSSKKRLVVAFGQDSHSIQATSKAIEMGIVEVTLVGDKNKILEVCQQNKIDPKIYTIVNETEEIAAGQRAVALIKEGKGDIIMKGLISSDNYLRAILNKEKGLLPPKAVLSHIGVAEIPAYHKLLMFSDGAVIPAPTFQQKVAIAGYLAKFARALGIERPKIAPITAIEKMQHKIPSCVEAAMLSKMADRGQIKNCIIDGPLALDVAIDKESAEIKGVKSEVAGDADCLLFNAIEAGNVFYKTICKFTKAGFAAVVMGTSVPCVLASRGDSTQTKLYSIALATFLG